MVSEGTTVAADAKPFFRLPHAVDGMNEPTEPGDAPNIEAMEYWDRVVADLEATAAEYDEAGWETLQLHPGDVTPLSGEHGDRIGLDVLVPDDEYRDLRSLLDDGVAFDAYRVYRADVAGMIYLVVAMEDADTETAVLYPAYYRAADPAAQGMLDRAHEAGRLRSYIRRLDGDYVQLNHDDPELLAPPEPEEGGVEDEDGVETNEGE